MRLPPTDRLRPATRGVGCPSLQSPLAPAQPRQRQSARQQYHARPATVLRDPSRAASPTRSRQRALSGGRPRFYYTTTIPLASQLQDLPRRRGRAVLTKPLAMPPGTKGTGARQSKEVDAWFAKYENL